MAETYILTLLVLLSLAFIMLWKIKAQDGSKLFDIENTNAIRGVGSIIVILVHIPVAFQNKLQDGIGSFAYIVVTFFFMTSAFGLMSSAHNKPDSIKKFWRRRLPSILIPCILVNLVSIIANLIKGLNVSALNIISINSWVRWLLLYYLYFWIVFKFLKNFKYNWLLVVVLIIAQSLVNYFVVNSYYSAWPTESLGFAYGILFYIFKDKFKEIVKNKWIIKTIVLTLICGIIGILYLKFKYIFFFGEYLLKVILGFALITLILVINYKFAFKNAINQFLGKISYEIYLLHGVMMGLLTYYLPNLNSGLFILITILSTVIIGFVINIIAGALNKPLRKLLKV